MTSIYLSKPSTNEMSNISEKLKQIKESEIIQNLRQNNYFVFFFFFCTDELKFQKENFKYLAKDMQIFRMNVTL